MFKNILAGLALVFAVSTVSATSTAIDTSGLTDAQIAELKAHAAAVVAQTAKSGQVDTSPEKVTAGVTLAATWGQQAAAAAEGFAKALGIAAKELNVTINDFLKSDAGKLTAVLIIWKVAGSAVIHFFYGILFMVVGLTMVRTLYTRLFTKEFKTVEYSNFGGFFKGTKLLRVSKPFSEVKTDGEWLAFWVMILLTLIVLIATGVIIT